MATYIQTDQKIDQYRPSSYNSALEQQSSSHIAVQSSALQPTRLFGETPIRWLLLLPVQTCAFGITQIPELCRQNLSLVQYLASWALSDWVATTLVLVSGWCIAPRYKRFVVLAATALASMWHTLVALQSGAKQSMGIWSEETAVFTAVSGLILNLVVAFILLQQDERQSVVAHLVSDQSVANSDDDLERYEEADMAMLEQELRGAFSQRDMYVSAIRFGFAVERDCGYQNCFGEHLRFNQIILDTAMRLKLMECEPSAIGWLGMANSFRGYDEMSVDQRGELVQKCEALLPMPEHIKANVD